MEDFKRLIYYTFIYDRRYMVFVSALGTTLLITLTSFILGTLAGVGFFAARRSSVKILSVVSKKVVAFFVQIPTMVMLLIFAYVIFGKSSAPILVIIILALTIKAGAYISEIIDTAWNGIDVGEMEAARTLGMSKAQMLKYIVIPQIIITGLPIYKNQFIVSMQETSMVGYLAVEDLTRASSVISSRTMDSLTSLLVITILYFLIGAVGKQALNLLRAQKHMRADEV